MIITSPGYMQTRSLEVGLGLAMLASGLLLVVPGQTLANPVFTGIRSWMPWWMSEEMGGFFLMLTAFARWVALRVNSHHSSTPLLRMAGCAVGSAFWLTSSISFLNNYTDALPLLLALTFSLFLMEVYSGVRTGIDAEALDSLGFRTRAYQRKCRGKSSA